MPSTNESTNDTAQILWRDGKGVAMTVELEGAIYHRASDQKAARKEEEQRMVTENILACGVSPDLLRKYEMNVFDSIIGEWDEYVKRVGFILLEHDRRDLWRLIYLDFVKDRTYRIGDEMRFLLGEPVADQLPPQPLDDEASA